MRESDRRHGHYQYNQESGKLLRPRFTREKERWSLDRSFMLPLVSVDLCRLCRADHIQSICGRSHRLLVTAGIQSLIWEICGDFVLRQWHVPHFCWRARYTNSAGETLYESDSLLSMDTLYFTISSVSNKKTWNH